MYFETKIYKFLNEQDVSDKVIKYKDADGNEKEATVGGILKQGKDHPAHDLAQKEMDKARGDDKQEPKPSAKIDANPFDDKEKEAPKKPATTHTDKEFKEKAIPIRNAILDDVIDNYGGNFDQWMKTGANQLPSNIDDALGELEAMSNADEVDKFKEDAYARIKNYVTKLGYKQGVGDEPDVKSGKTDAKYDNPMDGIDQEEDKLSDLFNRRKDDPEDAEAHDEMYNTLKDVFGDDMATSVMETGLEDFDNPEEFIDQLKGEAEMMMDESKIKQPFRENYNRLFKGRDIL